MGLGWTRAYEEAVKVSQFAPLTYEELARVAKSSFGDAGDRYICPLERRAIRKARRKARSMKSIYIVHGRFGKPRRFKHRTSAIKHYLALKASYGIAHITNLDVGISVSAPEQKPNESVIDLRSLPVNVPVLLSKVLNRDLFTKPTLLPAVQRQASLQPVTMAEVEQGPVIEHVPENLAGCEGGLWAGQVSYISKRFELLKDRFNEMEVVRTFRTLPPVDPMQRGTIMAIAGLYASLLGTGYWLVANALTKIAAAAPLAR